MAKRPEDRRPSMDELVADLERPLRELDGYGDDSRADARRARSPLGARRRVGAAAPIFLILLAVARARRCRRRVPVRGRYVQTTTATERGQRRPNVRRRPRARTTPRARAASTTPRCRSRPTATRRRSGRPRPTGLHQVGGRHRRRGESAVALDELTVTTDTPGFPARIRASTSAGPFGASTSRTSSRRPHDDVRARHEGQGVPLLPRLAHSCPTRASPMSTR